jgi:S1-C subfamily serine protease
MLLKIDGKEMPDTTAYDPNDGVSLRRFQEAFGKIAADIKPGAEVTLLVKREGEEKTIKATAIDKAAREKIEKENKEGPPKPKEPAPTPGADRGYVGFEARAVASLSAKQKKRWKVKAEAGVVAVRVLADSPAAKAGLANGDLLVKVADAALPTTQELAEAKDPGELVTSTFAKIAASVKPGAEVEIVVERDGKPVTLKAVAVDKRAIDELEAASDEPDDE